MILTLTVIDLDPESNGDHASSGFTAMIALDDIELFDVTSRPREHQE